MKIVDIYVIIFCKKGAELMKICDLHTHSKNSFDAQNSVADMCQTAIEKGFYAIAITDHCEAQMYNDGELEEYGDFRISTEASYNDICKAKEKYIGKLKVLKGIELAQPLHKPECTKEILSGKEYDFILASVHNIRNMDDFYFLDYSRLDINELLNLYFDELLETAEFSHFDSLAHITYPLRYIVKSTGKSVDLTPFSDKLDLLFKTLIKNNKALEINTQGLYKGLGVTSPEEAQIKRYRELGGKYITIGSDAHNCENLGKGIKEGIELAKKCGFTHYTIFENHKPILIEIE